VIHAWARSSEKQRARNAYQLLNIMTRRCNDVTNKRANQLKPNVKSFTAVLNACARPADDSEIRDAYSIAQLTMTELSLGRYGQPNFLSFAAFLSVCATTLEPGADRDVIVKKTFEDCINAGQVGQIVLEKLKLAASSGLFEELVRDCPNVDGQYQIPKHWKRNIRGERTASTSSDPPSTKGGPSKADIISNSSKQRLKAVQQFGGMSGVFSATRSTGGGAVEDISWSNGGFSKERKSMEKILLDSS
jgi:hypothetical protein